MSRLFMSVNLVLSIYRSFALLIFFMGFTENLIWYVHHIIYANVNRRAVCEYTKPKETQMRDMWEGL